jgi:hypothetical protein
MSDGLADQLRKATLQYGYVPPFAQTLADLEQRKWHR